MIQILLGFVICLTCIVGYIAYKLERSIKDQKEINKEKTMLLAKIDVALINLVDVPYLTNELDPGYAKNWSGKVPYKIPELFKDSEIKINDYIYTINKIEDDYISISRP